MKILIVANGYPPESYGGVEVYSASLAKSLVSRGHEVKVFCRKSDQAAPDFQIIEEKIGGIPVTRVINDFKGNRNFRGTYLSDRVQILFKQVLEAETPDIIHFNHLIGLDANLPFLAGQMNIPSILSLHDFWAFCQRVHLIYYGDDKPCSGSSDTTKCELCMRARRGPTTWKSRLLSLVKMVIPFEGRQFLRRLLGIHTPVMFPMKSPMFQERNRIFQTSLSYPERLLAPSNFVRETYAQNGYSPLRIQVLPLGIDKELFANPASAHQNQDGSLHLGVIGPIIPYKGIDVVIRAFKNTTSTQLRLDIYGREDTDPWYAAHLRELADGDRRIVFHGGFPPEDRPRIFSSLDAVIISSVGYETFSIVAREALLAGKLVIACAGGALPEIIVDGVNGFLYRQADPDDLTRVLKAIIETPEVVGKVNPGATGRILSMDEHTAELEKIYSEVITSRKRLMDSYAFTR